MACGAELGVGRFCLNCGHLIGAPVRTAASPPPVGAPPAGPVPAPPPAEPPPAPPPGPPSEVTAAPAAEREPVGLPVQAADPTPVAPVTPLEPTPERWDPREELLPYEEVDDPRADDPLPGRAWIAWVVGAVALVALVLVLLRVFASDGDDVATEPTETATSPASSEPAPEDTTDASEEAAPEPSAAPTGVGQPLDLATTATFEVPGTAPPTTDFDGALVAYEASQMHDGLPSTTWRTAGDATGQSITITLAEPAVVSRVGLVNGYAKQVAGVDWYPNNRRVLAVTWTFEDGTAVTQTLTERPMMQLIDVTPTRTSTITLTLDSVTPPGAGELGRDYTAISEVSIVGRRAG